MKASEVTVGMIVTVPAVAIRQMYWGGAQLWDTPTDTTLLVTRVNRISWYVSGGLFTDLIGTDSNGLSVAVVARSGAAVTDITDDVQTPTFLKNIAANLGETIGSGSNFASIGADPEIFVVDGRGSLIPAFTFLPSKADRTGVAFWDGYQAEFVTNSSTCLAYQVDYIHRGLQEVRKAARTHNPKAKLTTKSVMRLSPAKLLLAKDEHVALGCAPSLNAYPEIEPLNIGDPRQCPIRTAGCHLHFGIGRQTATSWQPIIKMIDRIAGVASVSICRGLEDTQRRLLYGRAGECRLPSYGIEYRTFSSSILAHPASVHLHYTLCRQAIKIARNVVWSKLWETTDQETVEVINGLDVKGAEKILNRNKNILEAIFKGEFYGDPNAQRSGLEMTLYGMDARVANPTDIEGNWYLDKGPHGWTGHSANDNCQITLLPNHKPGAALAA